MNNTGVKSRLGQETDWNRVRFLPWTDSVSLSFFFFLHFVGVKREMIVYYIVLSCFLRGNSEKFRKSNV